MEEYDYQLYLLSAKSIQDQRSFGMKKYLIAIFLILVACLSGTAYAGTDNGIAPVAGHSTKRKLIIDTDAGADDASALILAAKSDEVELLGVTVLAGNVDTEQGARTALMALEMAGSDAPVYKGSSENFSGRTINASSIYGSDGMGDAGLIHPKGRVQDKDAVGFILETINQYPYEVELVAIGPATNIAKAIERDPETMKKVKMIWSMGTAGLGPGNASPVAEFNVYADPAAYKAMLDSGIGISIVGLDACSGEAYWTDAQFERLESAGDIGKFVSVSYRKCRDFYKANGSAGVMNADGLTLMCVLALDFIKETNRYHCSCITEPGETYAQVIFYREGFTYDAVPNDFDHNVTLVSDVDKESFFERYLSMVS